MLFESRLEELRGFSLIEKSVNCSIPDGDVARCRANTVYRRVANAGDLPTDTVLGLLSNNGSLDAVGNIPFDRINIFEGSSLLSGS